MRKLTNGALLCAGLGLILSSWATPSRADTSTQAMRQTATDFAQALNTADASKLQAVCTPQLWGRIAPVFSGAAPAPGSLGVYEPGQATGAVSRPGYFAVYLLCRHPDGVEDVVLATLKVDGGAWKVCGGPTGATASPPF